jgi:hypothetical protein
MRKFLLVMTTLLLTGMAATAAEQSGRQKSDITASGKRLPLKRAAPDNSCAAYGPGFVKIEGTSTCMKIGGEVSIGAGTSAGSR